MFTAEQFYELMAKITRSQEDHDLLIGLKSSLETYQKLGQFNAIQQTKDIASAEKKAGSAHARIDKIIVIGGIGVFLTIAGIVITVLLTLHKSNFVA